MGHYPVVALLTDFGLRDHYVGAMKGVILNICPSAVLVDITHDVPPQDVLSGALELSAAFQHFPPRTVFVAVVDPGVGSTRLPVAAEAQGRYLVGPDNGLLSLVFETHAPDRLVHLSESRFALPAVSPTFEGRDRFAPAAAWLAAGTALSELGQPLETWVRLELPAPRVAAGIIDGEVLRADRFGNLMTNIPASWVVRAPATRWRVEIAGTAISGLVRTYAEASDGGLCALVGSTNFVEIAVRGGSAADTLGAGRGTPVRLFEGACYHAPRS